MVFIIYYIFGGPKQFTGSINFIAVQKCVFLTIASLYFFEVVANYY